MYKLRERIKEEFNKFDSVKEIIFTTFNFEVQFFQEQIIAYLMDVDKINTIEALSQANQWIKEHSVSVFYDKNMITDMDAYLTLDTYPMTMNRGVFHPKVIILCGFKKDVLCSHLFVSSANLTRSGYGRNIEGVSDIEMNTKEVVRSVRDFLNQLFEKADPDLNSRYPLLKRFLNQRKFDSDESVQFYYNFGDGNRKILNHLKALEGDMTIYSPYFCHELGKLLEEFGERNFEVVPALDDGKYNIEQGVYQRLKDDKVVFSQINSDRFPHAKMIMIGKYIIVGSHNFTGSALRDLNAEASLIIKKQKGNEKPQIEKIPVQGRYFPEDGTKMKNLDEVQSNRTLESVEVVVDWGERKVIIKSDNIKNTCIVQIGTIKICRLYSGDNSKFISFQKIPTEKQKISFEEMILTNKQFIVFKNDQIIIRGLINELNWTACRPEIKCGTLEQALQEWFYASDISEIEERAKQQRLPSIGSSLEDEECNESMTDEHIENDVFDNYFNILKSLHSLRKSIKFENRKVTEEVLYHVYKKAPGSICNMKELLDSEDHKEIVRTWIIENELYLSMVEIQIKYRSIKEQQFVISTFKDDMNRTIRELKKGITDLEREIILQASNYKYVAWIKKEFGY